MSSGNVGITVTPGAPPQNPYCFTSWSQTFADIINVATFVVSVGGGYFRQQTSPGTPPVGGPFVWFQLDVNGGLIRTFTWDNGIGLWTVQHQVPANSNERRLWFDLEANLPTYDGGDANPPGTASGPMWEVDHTFDAKIPIGPGTLPVSTTVVAVTNTGGTDQTTLGPTQVPPHTHQLLLTHGNDYTGGPNLPYTGNGDTVNDQFAYPNGTLPTDGVQSAGGNVSGGTDPLNIMPPYCGIFLIKRTPRVYYASP